MKNMNLRVLTLILILGAQTFAQRFTSSEPDIFKTGEFAYSVDRGYRQGYRQAAALGEKSSGYANLMLLAGRDSLKKSSYKAVDSYGKEYGDIWPIPLRSADTIYDNKVWAVVVLDSFSDNKKTAIALFATIKKLIVAELKINNSNMIEHSILQSLEMPESASQANDVSNYGRKLALLGTSEEAGGKVYHIATSNPNYKNDAYSGSGRIDFFSIKWPLWDLMQPNTKGVVAGDNMFNQNTILGIDLTSVGDLDGNGHNDLAVLLSSSEHFQNGAVYILFMDNEHTPNLLKTTTLAGESLPWKEEIDANKKRKYSCEGMSFAEWKNEPRLLLSCNTSYDSLVYSLNVVHKSHISFVKDISLNNIGNIESTNIFLKTEEHGPKEGIHFGVYSNLIPIANHKNSGPSIALPVSGPCVACNIGSIYVYRVADADASKNFSIEAGKQETVANIDSLFYNSGAHGYSVKTLAGLAKCRVQTVKDLICEAGEEAQGSWSMVELNSNGLCNPYKTCKKKDTIYVYARQRLEVESTALRIPKDIVVGMQSRTFTVDNVNSFAYFKNPGNLSTDIAWSKTGLQFISIPSETSDNFSIVPLPHEGIDTIVFSLSVHNSTNKHSIRIHIADSSKFLKNVIPEAPGNDTIWNTAQKKYIALPSSSSKGNLYTYDIAQDSLGKYAEVLGDYLHILNIDIANVSIAYTENSEIKYRKITLMPEPKPSPPSSPEDKEEEEEEEEEEEKEEEKKEEEEKEEKGQSPVLHNFASAGNVKAFYSGGQLHISGAAGELGIKAYNFKGVEIQREKMVANGQASLKLKQRCPQIVQISTQTKRIYITIFP
jgi:hypothetical protein